MFIFPDQSDLTLTENYYCLLPNYRLEIKETPYIYPMIKDFNLKHNGLKLKKKKKKKSGS